MQLKKALAFVMMITLIGQLACVASAKSLVHTRVHRTTSLDVYVADRTQEALLVYPLEQNPSPVARITSGIPGIGGVAVDASGNVYVANGGGRTGSPSVQEYSPGAASVLRVLTQGLHHPVSLTTDSNSNVWVTDQDQSLQGASGIVEFGPTGTQPLQTLTTPDANAYLHGVAVDAAGDVFVSLSGIGDEFPPAESCNANHQPTVLAETFETSSSNPPPGWIHIYLGYNVQEWGIALDPNGNLFASDFACNDVEVYTPPISSPVHSYSPGVALAAPMYLTIESGAVAVPNAGDGTSGFVTIGGENSIGLPFVINQGLEGPIGAAVGSAT